MHMGEVMCRRTVTPPSRHSMAWMSPISPMPRGTPVARLQGSGMSWMTSRTSRSLIMAVTLEAVGGGTALGAPLGELVMGDARLDGRDVHARVPGVVLPEDHLLHLRGELHARHAHQIVRELEVVPELVQRRVRVAEDGARAPHDSRPARP